MIFSVFIFILFLIGFMISARFAESDDGSLTGFYYSIGGGIGMFFCGVIIILSVISFLFEYSIR